MLKMNKALLGAVAAAILGIFFATVGFWRTIMIIFLTALGYLIGSYLETRNKE